MIVPMRTTHTKRVARMHLAQFPGYFTSLFGWRFLKAYYDAHVRDKKSFGFVYLEDGKVLGYVAGTADKTVLFRKNALRLGIAALPYLIVKPWLLIDVYRALTMKEETAPELFSIIVDRSLRGKGIGRKLVMELANAFSSIGIARFYLHVGATLPANEFYRKIGFRYVKTVSWSGNRMNILEYASDGKESA